MAEYTGYQSVLGAALGEYHAKGFNLSEDEHFLYLFYQGDRIAVFSGIAATPDSVAQACQDHLESLSVAS